MFKQIMSHTTSQKCLARMLVGYMGLVRRTTRWDQQGLEHIQALQQSGEGFIACAWHSRFLMTTIGWTKMPQTPHVLISRSRDGDLVSLTAKYLKLGVIRGSRVSKAKASYKNKGGSEALRDMVSTLKRGDCIFMTPDGPKGPRMRMGQGPIRLAKLSNAPLIGYALSTSAKISFKTWDHFMFPLPFGRGKIIWTAPLWINDDMNSDQIDTARTDFEQSLISASQACDTACGHEPDSPVSKPCSPIPTPPTKSEARSL